MSLMGYRYRDTRGGHIGIVPIGNQQKHLALVSPEFKGGQD